MSRKGMVEGECICIRLNGDEAWYDAVALDRPRKEHAIIHDFYGKGKDFIADESSIAEWRRK